MTTSSPVRSRRGLVAQWFGVLGAPAAWSFMLLANAFLGESLACSPGAIPALSMDSGVKVAVAGVNALAVLVSLAGLGVSLSCWRRLRTADATTGGRARWFAAAGMMVSILFLLIILAAFLPLVLIRMPCTQTP